MAKIALICMLFALIAVAHSASVPAEKPAPSLSDFPEFLQKSFNAIKDSLNDEKNQEKLKKEVQDAVDKATKIGNEVGTLSQEQSTKFWEFVQQATKTFQENLNKN